MKPLSIKTKFELSEKDNRSKAVCHIWFSSFEMELEYIKYLEAANEAVWFNVRNSNSNHFLILDQCNNFLKLNTKPDF